MRCLYKVESKRRILSIENNRLTLSGSRTSISSLSSSLIKFFEAEKEATEKQEYKIGGKQFKHRTKSSLNLNSKVWTAHRKTGYEKDSKIRMKQYQSRCSQYGIQRPNAKKMQTILKEKNNLILGEREYKRTSRQSQYSKNNQIIKKSNEWKGKAKWKTKIGQQNNPYFNFTFGTRQPSPNTLSLQLGPKKINK